MADQAGAARDKAQGVMQKVHQKSPNSKQVLGFVIIVAAGMTLLVGGGLALGGIVITLILATPLLIAASPVLIPLGIFLFMVTAGFLGVGGSVAVFVSIISWIYNYFKGRHPVGSDQVDAAKSRLAEAMKRAKDTTHDYAGYMKSRAEEAAPRA